MKRNYIIIVFATLLLAGCSLSKKSQIKKQLDFAENLHQNHVGFTLFDPSTKTFLIERNSDRYFTPASNTKIFTLYASLMMLGDQIPALKYVERGDSLIFWGTGDPSFLDSQFEYKSAAFEFLKSSDKELYFSSDNYTDQHFGPGWAWDDYQYSFSAEKSPFPIYGNTVLVGKESSSKKLMISVPYFKRYFYLNDSISHHGPITRKVVSNDVDYFPKKYSEKFVKKWPFKYSDLLLVNLLSDTLNTKVGLIEMPLPRNAKTLKGIPADSLYKKMMQQSDNFIAEQLLLVSSTAIGDSLKAQATIGHMQDQYLYDLPDEAVWVDGSGLSRYNLFTPRSLVRLWDKIHNEVEEERLFSLLAVGGESGTLKNNYAGNTPYIYAKTGTLSNNHNLSGFIKTKSGKTLIFSYMNNNHIVSSTQVKKEMERLLLSIHQKY